MVKKLPANKRRHKRCSLIPGLGRSPGGGHGNHSSILAWRTHWQRSLVGYSHRVAKNQTRLKQLSTHTHKVIVTRLLPHNVTISPFVFNNDFVGRHFEVMQINYLLSYYHPLILLSINSSSWQQLLLWCYPKGDFLFLFFLLHILKFSCKEEFFHFSHLFIYFFLKIYIALTYGYLF